MPIGYFDAHCDTIQLIPPGKTGNSGTGLRNFTGHISIEKLKNFTPCAQFFACFRGADTPDSYPERKQNFADLLNTFQREISANSADICFVRSGTELKKVWESGKIGAFLSVEGCEIIGCTIEGLDKAYEAGVRAIMLTWNWENVLSGSNSEGSSKGLTAAGKAFTRHAFDLPILVDVSHLSDPGFYDIYEIACEKKKPFIASHSNARSVCFHRRNLTDDMFMKICERDGIAGINLYSEFLSDGPDCSLKNVLNHIEHFCSLGGVKNIALGCDFDGCDRLPQEIQNVVDVQRLYEALLQANYSEETVRGIFTENLFRVVNEVLG